MSEQQEQTTNDEQTPAPKAPEGYVTKAELDRVLSDLHKHKGRANEYEGKLKAFEEKALAEKEDFKSLAERYKAEADEAKSESQKIKDSFIGEKKHTAVREAALRLGMRPEAVGDLDLLSLEGVVIETTSSGKVNVLGAEAYIQNLKSAKPHWFGSEATPTKVNPGTPKLKGEGAAVSETDLLKLSAEAQKSGDYTQYKTALAKYRTQKR